MEPGVVCSDAEPMGIDVEMLYRRYGPMVVRRCRRLLGDPDAAEDAMHDVFVQLHRRHASLEDRGLSSLLYRTATNVCLNRLRSQRRRPTDPGDDLLLRIAALDDTAGRADARSLLDRVLRREPESSTTIAVLHLHDGLTLEETAEIVGLSVSGVRKRLRRLKAVLGELDAAAGREAAR
jgi:RNA polymerase sigma factor (sigma-70 family)